MPQNLPTTLLSAKEEHTRASVKEKRQKMMMMMTITTATTPRITPSCLAQGQNKNKYRGPKPSDDSILDNDGKNINNRPRNRREQLLTLTATVFLSVSRTQPSFAFGNGFPGYDVNEKARNLQRDAIKNELNEQKRLAREEKQKRRREKCANGETEFCDDEESSGS
ncbi:unnamed protein product [Bathycoccus prasinos]|jgi:hypothetical protein